MTVISTVTLADYWREMVTVALLGTDRRDPPSPPTGGLADLAADDPQPTPSQRLLQQVAGCTVAQRAGLLPTARAPLVAPPDDDPRPVTPPSASATWRRIIDRLAVARRRVDARCHPQRPPVVARAGRAGTRPAPHRRDSPRAGAGRRWILGRWMIEWSPRLACTARVAAVHGGDRRAARNWRSCPICCPCCRRLRRRRRGTIAGGLASGVFAISHRAVLGQPRRPHRPGVAAGDRRGDRRDRSHRCRPSDWRSPSPTWPDFAITCSRSCTRLRNWRHHEFDFATRLPSCDHTPSTSSPTSSPRSPRSTIVNARRTGDCRRGPSSPICSVASPDGTVISPKYVGQRR